MNKLNNNEQMNKKKCFKFCTIRDDILFIMSDKSVISFNQNIALIQESYRNSDYMRYPNTSIRIAKSSIERNVKECNVLI